MEGLVDTDKRVEIHRFFLRYPDIWNYMVSSKLLTIGEQYNFWYEVLYKYWISYGCACISCFDKVAKGWNKCRDCHKYTEYTTLPGESALDVYNRIMSKARIRLVGLQAKMGPQLIKRIKLESVPSNKN